MTPIDHYLHAVLTRATQEARTGGTAVEAAHLLIAVAAEPEPTVHRALAAFGLDEAAVRGALAAEFEHSLAAVGVSADRFDLPRPSRLRTDPGMANSGKLALERAFAEVARKRDLRPAHLLLGILAAQVGTVPRALELAGVDRAGLVARVREELDR